MNTLSSLLKFIGDIIGAAPSTLTTTSKTLVGAINEIDSDVSGLLDVFYPVGSYYETDNANFDPNTAWGGTWVKEAQGKVHVSAGSTYLAGIEYGSNTHTHTTGDFTLGVDHIPSHSHAYEKFRAGATTWYGYGSGSSYLGNERIATDATGGGQAHNHGSTGSSTRNSWQPSIAVYRWHRTA